MLTLQLELIAVTRNGVLKKLFLEKADLADTTCVCFRNGKDNAAYALLMRAMEYAQPFDLTIEALMASSSLSPAFSIQNTLLLRESRQWSSIGREALSGTEALTYKLPELCLAYGFIISPFQGTTPTFMAFRVLLFPSFICFLLLVTCFIISFADTSLPGSPTFRAQRARFSFGNNDGTGFSETYSTKTHQMPSSVSHMHLKKNIHGYLYFYSTHTYQSTQGQLEVELPKPLLCINKQMVLELSDFVDKHPSETLYYIRYTLVSFSLTLFYLCFVYEYDICFPFYLKRVESPSSRDISC